MRILSGVFEDERTGGQVTTGTPISLIIDNVDQRARRTTAEIAAAVPARPRRLRLLRQVRRARLPRRRPRLGARDRRAGRRRRGRAQGARRGVAIRAAVVQIGPHAVDRDALRLGRSRATTPSGARTPEIVPVWEEHLDEVRKAGSSTGAIVEVEATGVPAGWGAPVYGKLDAELAGALMSINAAKGVEIGAGFAAAALSGEENADEMRMGNDGPVFLSNHAGGVLGGISTGQPVVGPRGLQADLLDPDAAPLASTRTARRSSCAPRAATTPASASAPRRWSRPWSPACSPTPSCATAARPAAARSRPAAVRRLNVCRHDNRATVKSLKRDRIFCSRQPRFVRLTGAHGATLISRHRAALERVACLQTASCDRRPVRYDLLKILLVDDNHYMRVLLAEILRAIGVKDIHEANDGAEGLQMMRDHADRHRHDRPRPCSRWTASTSCACCATRRTAPTSWRR